MDSPRPEQIPDPCNGLVREQIEILWRYGQQNRVLDAAFVHDHARMILQLTDRESLGRNAPKE